MKDLSNLSPSKGSNHKKKRLGRGPGSGHGKTAAKGHKGQKARKGGGIAAGFEGGQTPLYRRIPKRGFKNGNKTQFFIVKLTDLQVFDTSDRVDAETLAARKIIPSTKKPVKILANGGLEKPLTVAVNKISAGARAAVEKAGGKVEEI